MRGLRIAPLALLFIAAACSFDWNDYDPRLSGSGVGGTSATTTVGGGGVGGRGGQGGVGGQAPPPPWGDIRPVDALNTDLDEDDPSFTADLLEVYFNRDDPSTTNRGDIFVATRTASDDVWETPTLVVELSTPESDQNVVIAPDGLTIWLERGGDIYVATRSARSMPWTTPALAADLNTSDSETMSAVTDDLVHGVITRRVGGAIADLFSITRASSGVDWEPAVPIDELNSAAVDSQAWLSPDGLSVFFMSTRGQGVESIFTASRDSITEAWREPVRVSELATGDDRSDPWVSPDGTFMMFAQGVWPDRDIYEARRASD